MNITRKLKVGLVGTCMCMCLANPMMNVMAQEMPAASSSGINIEKPDGWKKEKTKVKITFDASQLPEDVHIKMVEAKIGEKGSWKNITSSMEVTISGNETVYVKVTDTTDKTYEQNRSILCYDSEKPTLSASLTDGVLTIQGQDAISGISSITVEGTTYQQLENDMLKIQLTQKDFGKKEIHMSVTDQAGNNSGNYVIKNPYYGWKDPQAGDKGDMNPTSPGNNGGSTASGTEQKAETPLPQDPKPSEPTSAKGTVIDRTVTGAVESKGESVSSVTQSGQAESKVFYTITTKSGKIFYLVIDNTASSDNVYFLTEASERDLLNFTMSDTVTLPDTVHAVPESELDKTEQVDKPGEDITQTDKKEEQTDVKMPEDKSGAGMYTILAIAALIGVGAGYYFKVYKPKHEYDDEEEYDEGYSEEDESELEVEEETKQPKEIGEKLEILPMEDEEE